MNSPHTPSISMHITLTNTGKRFNREWIFRHFNYEFFGDKSYAITGPNGSGKSTLLLVIGGAIIHNEGSILYDMNEERLGQDAFYKQIAIAAPYLEMIEEMTATEMLEFHAQFKPFVPGHPISGVLEFAGLKNAAHKQIRYFSSGMKQRLKLVQAFFSNTPVLMLDEPTTNLDEEGIGLYQLLIRDHTRDRLVIISSNDKKEYESCDKVIEMSVFK